MKVSPCAQFVFEGRVYSEFQGQQLKMHNLTLYKELGNTRKCFMALCQTVTCDTSQEFY